MEWLAVTLISIGMTIILLYALGALIQFIIIVSQAVIQDKEWGLLVLLLAVLLTITGVAMLLFV